MRLGLRPFGLLGGGKRKKVILLTTVVVLVLLVWGWKLHKKHADQAKPNQTLTLQQEAKGASDFVQKNIDSKNYDNAVQGCLTEASSDTEMNNFNAAKTALQRCVADVPSANIPWYYYNVMAGVAQKLNDKELQKSSLQNAIAKATEQNSDVPQATIDALKKALDSIK